MSSVQALLILRRVVQPIAAANVIEMSPMSMEGVVLNIACINSTLVLPDNLEDFIHLGGEEAGLIVKPVAAGNRPLVRGVEVQFTRVHIDQVWRLGECHHPVV